MAYIFRKCVLPNLGKNYQSLPRIFRTFTTGKSLAGNYEGDGKTTVTILNREYKNLIMIDSYNQIGFRMNNGIFVVGAIAAFPRTILQWNINNVAEITPKSLSLFCLLQPKLDILIIGTGDHKLRLCSEAVQYLKAHKISTEILPTSQACTIFNFLNTEGRCIAGAFIPPEEIVMYSDELKILETVEAIDDHVGRPDKFIRQ